jgi:hypothetical protein
MKFKVKGPFKENVYNLMRKTGYVFQRKDESKREIVFVRPPSGYPRFHIFLKEENDSLIFNLHLDQKKPVYKGTTAHSGEYDTDLIEEEKQRIEKNLTGL